MLKIKNLEKISLSPERKMVFQVIEEGLQAIDTKVAVKKAVKMDSENIFVGPDKFKISEIGKIIVIGVGKCAMQAVESINDVLGEKISAGVVLDIHAGEIKNKNIKSFIGDHPFPSERNIVATREMINVLKGLQEKDLVIAVVSGGGSALLSQPKNLTVAQEGQITDALFRAGAPIQEVNVVRKHFSLAKGGFLAEYAFPASVAALLFSDVPGDDMRFIASGPTVYDDSTVDDAKKMLDKYGLSETFSFLNDALIETPKEKKYFDKVKNTIIVSNTVALRAMKSFVERNGFKAEIVMTDFCGFAENIGKKAASALNGVPENTFLFYGGESTVLVKGSGKGGRNLEVSLSALPLISENDMIISLASDGHDNTDFAGGICDTITKKKAERMSVDPLTYLQKNDSYHFFEKTGDFIETGDTGSNVSDVILSVRFKK